MAVVSLMATVTSMPKNPIVNSPFKDALTKRIGDKKGSK
jgi:hypothetical protein